MPGFKIAGIGDGPNANAETARSNRWVIRSLGPFNPGNDTLLFAKELALPTWKSDKLEVLGSTLWYKYAKNIKWEDITLVFYDNIKIADDLKNWREKIHTEKEGIKTHGAGGYKLPSSFEELDGAGNPLRKIQLAGSWPVSINYGKLTYSESSIKVVEMTLTYDYAVITNS